MIGRLQMPRCNCRTSDGKTRSLTISHDVPESVRNSSSVKNVTRNLCNHIGSKHAHSPCQHWLQLPCGDNNQANFVSLVMESSPRCANCGQDSPLKCCARCLCVYYCSKQCQSAHYTVHKPTCTLTALAEKWMEEANVAKEQLEVCARCRKVVLKKGCCRCRICFGVSYCGPACQQKGFWAHKALCKMMRLD